MNKKGFIAAVAAAVLTAAQAVPAGADTVDGLQQKKAENTAQLEQLQNSINDLEAKKQEITGQITTLDANLVTTIASVDSLKTQISDKETQIKETKTKLNAATAKKNQEYSAMKKRIQYIYENGGNAGWAGALMNGTDISDILNKAEYTEQMYDYDRDCLEEYSETVNEVADLESEQEDEKSELETMKSEQEAQKTNLESMLEQAKATSADYDTQLADAQAKAAEYQQLIEQQNQQIQQLIAEQATAAAAAAAASSGAEDSDGVVSNGSATGQEIVDFALNYVGHPYVWGGNSLSNGTDCSGFIHLVYAHFGYSVPRQSADLRSVGRGVSYAEAQPGDIICYDGHCAIYMGGGRIVHASSARTGIKVSQNAAYRTILAVRRVV
jgi:cell wall-associated NlpC family hydrolase